MLYGDCTISSTSSASTVERATSAVYQSLTPFFSLTILSFHLVFFLWIHWLPFPVAFLCASWILNHSLDFYDYSQSFFKNTSFFLQYVREFATRVYFLRTPPFRYFCFLLVLLTSPALFSCRVVLKDEIKQNVARQPPWLTRVFLTPEKIDFYSGLLNCVCLYWGRPR